MGRRIRATGLAQRKISLSYRGRIGFRHVMRRPIADIEFRLMTLLVLAAFLHGMMRGLAAL